MWATLCPETGLCHRITAPLPAVNSQVLFDTEQICPFLLGIVLLDYCFSVVRAGALRPWLVITHLETSVSNEFRLESLNQLRDSLPVNFWDNVSVQVSNRRERPLEVRGQTLKRTERMWRTENKTILAHLINFPQAALCGQAQTMEWSEWSLTQGSVREPHTRQVFNPHKGRMNSYLGA